MTDRLVERLSRLDTCAVSDAADSLGIRSVAAGLAKVWDCGRIAGRAVTVKLAAGTNKGSKTHLGTRAIEAAASEHVIVVDNRGRADAAGWGGVLSYAAKQKGIRGVVVDGAIRDADESREIGFPVFSKSVTPSTARGRVKEVAFNEEIEVCGIAVSPGDLVLADGSGVVLIPADKAEEIVTQAEAIAEREKDMIRQLQDGRSIIEVMGAKYESMLDRS